VALLSGAVTRKHSIRVRDIKLFIVIWLLYLKPCINDAWILVSGGSGMLCKLTRKAVMDPLAGEWFLPSSATSKGQNRA
jgi:hypothetical protein